MRFSVTPEKQKQLETRMAACGLKEGDFEESFSASSGPGGQKANKTATCVTLLHRPSGIAVKMQKARSQSLNRYYARKRLCELMEAKLLGRESPAEMQREKIRRQKARRKRRSDKKSGDRE